MTTVERRAAVEIAWRGADDGRADALWRRFEVAPGTLRTGQLRAAPVVRLDLHHDPERAVAWLPDGGLTLRDEERLFYWPPTCRRPAADLPSTARSTKCAPERSAA